jgi:ferredoxin
MKRQIIKIDNDKCDGCGLCIPNCPEGALQVIDGKVRMVGDLLCDGLGACIGHCPKGALLVEEREAEPYDEKKTMENIIKGGEELIKAHLEHLKSHGQTAYLEAAHEFLEEHDMTPPAHGHGAHQGGCPGMKTMDLKPAQGSTSVPQNNSAVSELRQWPIQLHLLNPKAPYFQNAELLIAADCVPFAFPNFHARFLKGKILIILCPKLDQSMDAYLEQLTLILRENTIKSATVAHMEVPCCFGTVGLVEEAVQRSGKNVTIKEYTIALNGGLV